MSKKDIERARKVMERYDPEIVSAALGEMDLHRQDIDKAKDGIAKAYRSVATESPGLKMEILSRAMTETRDEMLKKEVETVKGALKGIDPGAILEVAQELIGFEEYDCLSPICICPEGCDSGRFVLACPPAISPICPPFIGPGCDGYIIGGPCVTYKVIPGCFGHDIWCKYVIDPLQVDLMELGNIHVQVIQELLKDDLVNIVIGDGRQFGMLGKCWDEVKCWGRQIWIMSQCTSSLVTFDIGAKINPVDAIIKIAEKDPTLKKRVDRMMAAMGRG